ncbi:MAG: hypothetical protein OXE84_02205 [Rhodobacteraceae bacterium]|nr:hypothetical protein [Paracoccaceae bacterium]MCY4327406.1 hypothetical protein [Paracoccaceae bacterium]
MLTILLTTGSDWWNHRRTGVKYTRLEPGLDRVKDRGHIESMRTALQGLAEKRT